MVYIYFLVLVLVFSSNAGESNADETEDQLREICEKDRSIYFVCPKDVLRLVERVEGSPSLCSNEEFHGSIKDLRSILDDAVMRDVCGTEAYLAIRRYYSKYISPYKPESSKEELDEALELKGKGLQPIPRALRKFFILFVQQVSGQCKRDLVARLDELVREKEITDSDFTMMEKMKEEGSRLFGYTYVERAKRLSDLVIPITRIDSRKSLAELMRQEDASNSAGSDDDENYDDGGKLYIQVRFGDSLMLIKQACSSKFIPVYEELFMPVIRLSNLGFYDLQNTEHENEQLRFEDSYLRWYGAIQSCELLRDIEFIQDTGTVSIAADIVRLVSPVVQAQSKGKSTLEANKARKLVILSAREARELKRRNEEGVRRNTNLALEEPRSPDIEHRPVAFTALMWLSSRRAGETEIAYFEIRNSKLIKKRRSFLSLLRRRISLYLRSKFHRYKLQVVHRDQSSALGRIVAFTDRHKVAIRFICSIIGLIVVLAIWL